MTYTDLMQSSVSTLKNDKFESTLELNELFKTSNVYYFTLLLLICWQWFACYNRHCACILHDILHMTHSYIHSINFTHHSNKCIEMIITVFCFNECTLRRKLVKVIYMLEDLQRKAELLNSVDFVNWIYNIKLWVMICLLERGFRLGLYATHELASIFKSYFTLHFPWFIIHHFYLFFYVCVCDNDRYLEYLWYVKNDHARKFMSGI